MDYTFIMIDLLGFISAVEKTPLTSPIARHRLSIKVQISAKRRQDFEVREGKNWMNVKNGDEIIKMHVADCVCVCTSVKRHAFICV